MKFLILIFLSLLIHKIESKDSEEQKLKLELDKIFHQFELNPNFITRLVWNTKSYVIFDCNIPSYIKPNNQLAILKNHIINNNIERMNDPRINDTSIYICDKKENIWRVNPDFFKSRGIIAFDDTKPAEADMNFITLADEKDIKDYLKNIDNEKNKLSQKIIELAFKINHHPKYYKIDKKKKPFVVDVFEEQNKKIPKWIRDMRQKEIDYLYDKLTEESSNFSIPKQTNLKQNTFGDGFSFIVFDCDTPSYLYPAKNKQKYELIKLDKQFKFVFNKMGRCDANDKLWRSGKASNNTEYYFMTYDTKGKGLGYSSSNKFLTILKIKGLCEEYMKYFYHPGYFLKTFKKQHECESDTSNWAEENNANKLLDDYNKKIYKKSSTKKLTTTTKSNHLNNINLDESSDSGFFSE